MAPNQPDGVIELDAWIDLYQQGFDAGKREITRMVDERRDDVTNTDVEITEMTVHEITALQAGFKKAREDWEPGVEIDVEAAATAAYAEDTSNV